MSRLLSLALVVLVVGSTVPIGATATAAQNATGNDTTTSTLPDDAASVTTETQLTDTLRITGWSYQNGTFAVTFVAAVPTSIKITDTGRVSKALAEGGDSAQTVTIRGKGYSLSSGETTVRFRATVYDGDSAITVGSPGNSALLRTGAISHGDRPAVEWESVQILVLSTAVVVGAGAVTFVRRRRDDEQVEVERLK
jgi:hypothetical protein